MMRFSYAVSFLAVILFAGTGFAQIHKVATAQEVRACLDGIACDQDVLFAFDIDETIWVADKHDARSAGFGKILAEQLTVYGDFVAAIDETRRLYRLAQDDAHLKPVDPELIELLNELNAKGVRLIGLTSRSRELCDITPSQLRSVGLASFAQPLERVELVLPPHEFPLVFENGVFFTSGAHKGLCLGRLLREFDWQPKTIIFIDDSYHHTEGVEMFCNMAGIPVKAFHFTAYQKTEAALEDRLIK